MSLPVKAKQDLIPESENQNRSTLEIVIKELSEEVSNLVDLRESIEHSFHQKNVSDDMFQNEVTSCFNSLRSQFDNLIERFNNEIDYNRELEEKIKNKEYQGQIFVLDRALNEERAKISKTLDELCKTVKESMLLATDKIRELNYANNVIEDNILKFRADANAASDNQYAALKLQTENMLRKFTDNAKTTLETVKKNSIDFIKQCEKENKALISKVPEVKSKLTIESWIVIIFGCIGIASFIMNFM